eukprot:SAG22_NODE_20542_length_265_cov_0.512048_1_plen_85_part_01
MSEFRATVSVVLYWSHCLCKVLAEVASSVKDRRSWEGQKLAERHIEVLPLLARWLSLLLPAPLPLTRFSRARYMSPDCPAILALL